MPKRWKLEVPTSAGKTFQPITPTQNGSAEYSRLLRTAARSPHPPFFRAERFRATPRRAAYRVACGLAAIQLIVSPIALAQAFGMPAENARTRSLPVEEFALDNGMTFLLLRRAGVASVAAGWVARVGSADDPPGQAGLSHLLEHVLFKGTRTIGTRNLDRELALLDRQDELRSKLIELKRQASSSTTRKSGKLENRILALEKDFATTQQEASNWAYLGQFSFLYSEIGATGLNANTYPDMTVFFVRVPANRLEAWFWLESDRLLEPVFREFYKEIEIVHEERRIRIDSTPTGALDEEVGRLFWDGHPYAIGPQGLASDLDRLSRPSALQFFRRQYRPENLTAVLVGDFDPQQIKAWAKAYFGRLRNQEVDDTKGSSPAVAQPSNAERLFEAACDCSPQIKIHYPSAAFGHPDVYPLDVLAGVLNGRTGRLYRDLVLDQEIAFSAFVQQQTRKQAGQFSFFSETKSSASPHDLLEAWDREVTRLKSERVGSEEIARAVNRMSGDAFRSLKDPMDLMSQLLYYQGLGDWHRVETWVPGIRLVTAADIQRVAREYLEAKVRTVALYSRVEPMVMSAEAAASISGAAAAK